MKLGLALPHIGDDAARDAILAAASEAEALGFASVWVLERLLWPLHPTAKYPGHPRGELPAAMQVVYEPLTVLSFLAARTRSVRLGTSVLVAPYRSPVLVAKIAATLDQLSQGRFVLGLGSGWSKDEFAAIGSPFEQRDGRTDEFIRALRAMWGGSEIGFQGRYYRIPPSVFLPKPVQQPGPPIWIGGNSARAIRRAAELGDGWHPTSRLGPSEVARGAELLRRLAAAAGRDPDRMEISLRWNDPPLATEEQARYTARRLRAYGDAGVSHVCFDLNIPNPRPLAKFLASMKSLYRWLSPGALEDLG